MIIKPVRSYYVLSALSLKLQTLYQHSVAGKHNFFHSNFFFELVCLGVFMDMIFDTSFAFQFSVPAYCFADSLFLSSNSRSMSVLKSRMTPDVLQMLFSIKERETVQRSLTKVPLVSVLATQKQLHNLITQGYLFE